MEGHHVPAQRRASAEEEVGAQGWSRARQPETDGVRAQRLGLRFAASVAAGLALAAVLVCLSSAPGWGGAVLLGSADVRPDAAVTVSAARLEALADSEAHAIFATAERTGPQADGALAAKLLKMQASAWAKGEARRLAASLASATRATDEDAPTPRDDALSATVLDTLRRTDPAVVERGDFLKVSPERAFFEAHKDVFKLGHEDRVAPAEHRVAHAATPNAPGWTSPHHVTAVQPPREDDAVRLAPVADVHGQHQTPEKVVEAFAADTATAAPRSAEPVPAPSVIVTGDVASAVPASVVDIFKQQDAKDSAEAAAEAEAEGARRRAREREVQASARARLEARVAQEEKEAKEEEAEEAENAARKARLAQEEREAKEEEVRVMREQAKLLKKKAEAAKDSLALAGSLVRAAATHAAQRPAQGDRKSIDAKSTDAAHTQSTGAHTHAAAAEATQRAAAGRWGTRPQGLEWPSSRAAATPRAQHAGQVLSVQEHRAPKRLSSVRKQLERARQARGGGGGGDGMSGAHAQPALLASVPPKALVGKLSRTRGAGGLDLLRRGRLQQQPSVSILPPANARGEARTAATPVSAQALRDQPAAAIVPPGGAAVQPAAANVSPSGAVRIVPPGGPAQPQEQDESNLPTVPEFSKVSIWLCILH